MDIQIVIDSYKKKCSSSRDNECQTTLKKSSSYLKLKIVNEKEVNDSINVPKRRHHIIILHSPI